MAPAEVGLDEADLAHMRLVADGDGEVGPALALQDPLPWPESLLTDDFAADRARLEAALAVAREQAAKGPIARSVSKDVIDAADRMDQRITAKVRGTSGQPAWSASDAIEAGSFLDQFRKSAVVLQRPGVSSYLNSASTRRRRKTVERTGAGHGVEGPAVRPGVARRQVGLQGRRASSWRPCDAKAYATENDAFEEGFFMSPAA